MGNKKELSESNRRAIKYFDKIFKGENYYSLHYIAIQTDISYKRTCDLYTTYIRARIDESERKRKVLRDFKKYNEGKYYSHIDKYKR